MRIFLRISLCLAGALWSFGQTPETIRYENLPGVVLYSNGYLVSWDSPQYTKATIFGPDGRLMYSKPQREGSLVYNNAWAVDSDGVSAGVYRQRSPWKGRLDILDATGKVKAKLDTESYLAQHVVFAPDHTLWTVGFIAGNDGSKGDFDVLRHYSRSAEELGRALRWSQIAGGHNSYTALQPYIGGRQLYASNDRIGFLSRSDDGVSSNTWIEVSFSGELLGIYGLGRPAERIYVPAAMTSDGNVYAMTYRNKQFDGWATLNRAEKIWQSVSGLPQDKPIGSQGQKLVFARRHQNATTLQFLSLASLRTENTQQTNP